MCQNNGDQRGVRDIKFDNNTFSIFFSRWINKGQILYYILFYNFLINKLLNLNLLPIILIFHLIKINKYMCGGVCAISFLH